MSGSTRPKIAAEHLTREWAETLPLKLHPLSGRAPICPGRMPRLATLIQPTLAVDVEPQGIDRASQERDQIAQPGWPLSVHQIVDNPLHIGGDEAEVDAQGARVTEANVLEQRGSGACSVPA